MQINKVSDQIISNIKDKSVCFIKVLNKRVNFHNKLWFVSIALIGSLVTIFSLFSSINKISDDLEGLKFNYNNIYNKQSIKTSKLNGDNIIKEFINSLNHGDYQQACSLISTRHCSMYDVNLFTDWVKDKKRYMTVKLKNGEKLLNTWDSGIILENINTEIWCGEIEYTMNTENRPIKEIRQYYISTRPDGNKEIGKILCENAVKNSQDRTKQICGYITENRYCSK